MQARDTLMTSSRRTAKRMKTASSCWDISPTCEAGEVGINPRAHTKREPELGPNPKA